MSTHLLDALAETPQSEKLEETQVLNSAGGYVFEVNDWTKLRRFLILGSEGGSYYASERDLTKSGLKNIEKLIKEDAKRVVDIVVEISQGGLAAKNDYAIFALALVAAKADVEGRRYALDNLGNVARIGTHLFQFAEYLNKLGNLSGRAKRRAFAKWYTDKNVDQAAYQAIKYRQRNGWTHRDILRVAHPGSISEVPKEHADLFGWITSGEEKIGLPKVIEGFQHIQRAATAGDTAAIIREYNLPREAVPTEYLTNAEVWRALLENMPVTALIRNLANMTRIGVLTSTSAETKKVVETLRDEEVLRRSRVHPFNVLVALYTYASGAGFRGSNTWTPVRPIVDALDGAFYKSFGNVEPTGKRIMLAIDISGSMTWVNIANTNLTPRDAASAMALVTAATEDTYEITAFSAAGGYGRRGTYGYNSGITPVDISPRQRLDDAVNKINGMTAGGTDCALPMIWAKDKSREFDAFIVYTDNETWAGSVHPSKALQNYRKASGINDAKLITVGMVSNNFSIADENDPGMLDVVGFDTSAPQIMSDFISGRI